MGTAQEWFLVLVVGFLFGGFMAMLSSRPKFVQPPRIYWKLYILDYVLFGLWFGVVEVFKESRPFRPPLVYLNVGILVCLLLVSYSLRRITRNLPRLPKKPALFPVSDFSRTEKKPGANNVT
jgi:hypothetical protein